MNIINYLLTHYNWTPVEEELIQNHFEDICNKFANMSDYEYDKLFTYFDKWLLGECPKSRLNYWMRKTGTSIEELNIFATY